MKDVARFFKALADEARLEMLCLLFEGRELCVCDIMGALGITQSKASRHLATLRHAGLVTDRREAAWSYYSLSPASGELQRALLEALRPKLAERAGAARVRRNLRQWLKRKGCGPACSASLAGAPARGGGQAMSRSRSRSRSLTRGGETR